MSERDVHLNIVPQPIIVTFLTNEGIRPAEILKRLQAQFEEICLKKTQVYDWNNMFVEGQVEVKNANPQPPVWNKFA